MRVSFERIENIGLDIAIRQVHHNLTGSSTEWPLITASQNDKAPDPDRVREVTVQPGDKVHAVKSSKRLSTKVYTVSTWEKCAKYWNISVDNERIERYKKQGVPLEENGRHYFWHSFDRLATTQGFKIVGYQADPLASSFTSVDEVLSKVNTQEESEKEKLIHIEPNQDIETGMVRGMDGKLRWF
jgi:hypothetical protein